MTLLAKIKFIFNRDLANLFTIREFGHQNKDLLIIVCDPKEDRMYVSYKDKFVNGRIKSASGKNEHVVKNVIKASRFHVSINDMIVAIAETLNVPLKTGNQFYQFIDGAIYKIGKSLQKRKEGVVHSPDSKGKDEVGV